MLNHSRALVLAALPLLLGATPGRDFVPGDDPSEGQTALPSATVHNAIMAGGNVYVFYQASGGNTVIARRFDPTTGFAANWETVVSPGAAGSLDDFTINSSAVSMCALKTTTETLTLIPGTRRYTMSHIGTVPSSINVSGSGSCSSLAVLLPTHWKGRYDGSSYTTDSVELTGTSGCSNISATYDYTECSLTGNDRYRCGTDHTGDAQGDEYCRYYMMYEGTDDDPTLSTTNRYLFLAHAQNVDGDGALGSRTYRKYVSNAVSGDERLGNTSQHECETTSGNRSFVSVPDILWDSSDQVHRMWFVTEDAGGHSIRYSESPDDGLTWGIHDGTSSWASAPRDCWNGASFDATACTDIDWATGAAPPDFSDTNPVCGMADWRNPDFVDPEVYRVGTGTWAMLGAGTHQNCNLWGAILYTTHGDFGDQSSGTKWSWVSSVENDASYGIVTEDGISSCGTYYDVLDPTVVEYAVGKFVLFYNNEKSVGTGMDIRYGGSGFQCSDFADNDGDGLIDVGSDLGCTSGADDSE